MEDKEPIAARGYPVTTVLLSALCLAIRFWHEFLTPLQQRVLVDALGARPSEIAAWLSQPVSAWHGSSGTGNLLLALFVHSDWTHLLGNLAYLWVFGIPVERRLGGIRLALVFLLGGALAHLIVALRLPSLDVPIIGASGAVSAVVGAYLGLFPRRQLGLYLPLGMFVQFTQLPALLVIGSWFALQLVYAQVGPISGAVSWWTHLTGFALGLMLALLARAGAQVRK